MSDDFFDELFAEPAKVKRLPLNQGQQAAADGFFAFLMETDKELNISGPGGVGKTFLMGHLIDEIMPQYYDTCKLMGIKPEYNEVVMTATTNKAAEVLSLNTGRPASTIHSFLGLKVQDDYESGRSKLTKTKNWTVHRNKIIFIDECSMIDTPLRKMILEGTHSCKIIYVGDHCQLAPVMEVLSPIYRSNLPFFELTEPMRTDKPELLALNLQLHQTVETGEFKPIQIVPGIIDHLNGEQMQALVDDLFIQTESSSRLLAYTNKTVVNYNDYIRELRGLAAKYTVGEILVNNSAVQVGKGMISVEQEVTIVKLADTTEMVLIEPREKVYLEIIRANLETSLGEVMVGVPLPVDRDHHTALVKYYGKCKEWTPYFHLKNTYPDLRPRDSCTVHKSQGSSYDISLIDLDDLSSCRNPDLAARLLYVGISRARHRVVFYGDLVEKYGGLIH